ncbi:interleukin-6 receptor subunit beta [Chanodichthys erythropterus]|uniref:interleukin-6 receptor subunit beta n=1 Tax=Chanodichthys erythropterus TaxID=933992 RepID=UPI00351DF1A0
MSGRGSLCVLICVFCFCCASKRKHVQELTVTGKDLKGCGKQKKVCVTSSDDCLTASDVLTATPESFVNVSCHSLEYEESFTCRWIQMSDVRTETVNTFIFRRADDIISCPSILNYFSRFNLIIKSKSVSLKEQFSEVYPVIIKEIVQAPRPVITSVNVTDSSVNVTWNGGKIQLTKCRIRYKHLKTESWTQTADFPASDESLFVIEGLQAFSEYRLSVSCFYGNRRWSDWSDETRVQTSESLPSASLSLSYHVASDGNSGGRQLLLLWKALDVTDARGLIRGYEVSYMPTKQPSLKKTFNTTDLKAVVRVTPEEYEVTVWANNSAGRSPPRRLRVDASRSHDVQSVKGLWVYSDGSSLRIRWERDFSAVNVSEFAIEWSAETNPIRKHWQRIDGSMFTTRLTGIEPDETYTISVYPVYDSLCGPPTSISADLQHGALLDLARFLLVNVTQSSLAVQWTWKEAKPRVSVRQYRLVLEGAHGNESLSVFPDKQQHTFDQLRANAKYSVYIQEETRIGNFSKASLDVNTPLIDYDEMMRFAVPVVLLLLVFGIFSVSSRTIFREYFFPIVANPRYSLIGRWLLNPHLKGSGKICVLKLESSFQFDQQENNFIQVERRVSSISEHEDVIPSKISTTGEGTALWKPNSDALAPSSLPEYVDLPLLADISDYVQTGQMSSVAQTSD